MATSNDVVGTYIHVMDSFAEGDATGAKRNPSHRALVHPITGKARRGCPPACVEKNLKYLFLVLGAAGDRVAFSTPEGVVVFEVDAPYDVRWLRAARRIQTCTIPSLVFVPGAFR